MPPITALLSHVENQGKGAALKTVFESLNDYVLIVTIFINDYKQIE